MLPLPKAASASAWACCSAAFSARSFSATRMPRPPPPADALISTGKPISCAIRTASASSSISPSLPGTTGTSASRASLRAAFLSPSSAIASGEGPMNSILQLRQTSAKWAFSARKP